MTEISVARERERRAGEEESEEEKERVRERREEERKSLLASLFLSSLSFSEIISVPNPLQAAKNKSLLATEISVARERRAGEEESEDEERENEQVRGQNMAATWGRNNKTVHLSGEC